MSLIPWRPLVAAGVLSASLFGAAHAGTVSYTGTFVADDDRFAVAFAWAGIGTFTARTFSYGGGINGAAATIAAGGFAPVLALFDSTGLLLADVSGSASDCSNGVGAADPATGYCWDAGFSATLVAGAYTLILTQDGNTPNGPFLADGYARTGMPSYTGADYAGDDSRTFVNVDGSQRDGHWALDISGTPAVTAVSEPYEATLFFTGLALLMFGRRRVLALALRTLGVRAGRRFETSGPAGVFDAL